MTVKTKWFKAKCSQCGTKMRRRTRTELLSALRKHLWSKHKNWMITRIRSGRREAQRSNPSFQDLASALGKGSARAATSVAKQMTEGRYQSVKRVMDAVSPMLPDKARVTWEAVEAGHDIYRKLKGGKKR